VDLVEMCTVFGIILTRRRGTQEYHGRCPSCGGSDSADRFVVWPKLADEGSKCVGRYWCRKNCGCGGDSISFAMRYLDLSFRDAYLLATGSVPEKVLKSKPRPTGKGAQSKALLLPSTVGLDVELHPIKPDHLAYLESRGISSSLAKEFGLGSTKDGTAISIPIWYQEVLVGVKYKNCKEGAKLRFWSATGSYGGAALYRSFKGPPGKALWIVESELDAIMLSPWVPSVLAVRSASNNMDQISYDAIKGASVVMLSPDMDDPGLDSAIRFAEQFNQMGAKGVLVVAPYEPHKDVGDFVQSRTDKEAAIQEVVNFGNDIVKKKGWKS
jgi:hypothetical protein